MTTYDDPRILRAIAHPTRNRILAELGAAGTSRAADLAQALDIPANQASFHLRQLAKYGLVEEAPEEARDRRDRVWRLADESGISFRTKDVLSQPGGAAAVEVFRRSASARGHMLVESAYADTEEKDVERVITEEAVRLTVEEMMTMTRELADLVEAWRRRARETDAERSTYSVYQLIQPYPDVLADVPEPTRVQGFSTPE
ncbi:winged helix-turn-helix domain-containing protein [Nocardioides sp. Kera G14]|uniref:winged helix-turn-helix domain-containing protein n=1 Tax=Nocardioides sp. Kera G14 TaxID=2884264 RepID=UPI001D106C20|nr:helix-turn-helix domain-containing protein [Nocardioides sp. Kera G14]UDY23157.1 helix-turn-helix domain-containing protein [Nocardioides sp. Kera G14]